MDIRWIAAPFSLLVIVIVLKRWWKRIIGAANWLVELAADSRTCEVAKTCCGEVAVLLVVFPTIDTLYDHKHLSDPILRASIVVGLLFFLFAVILAHAEKPAVEDEED